MGEVEEKKLKLKKKKTQSYRARAQEERCRRLLNRHPLRESKGIKTEEQAK